MAGTRVTPVPVLHGRLPIYGYRVGSFAYVTDCSAIPDASWPLLEGLDVLVLDALRHAPHPTHFTVAQALDGDRARAAGPRAAHPHRPRPAARRDVAPASRPASSWHMMVWLCLFTDRRQGEVGARRADGHSHVVTGTRGSVEVIHYPDEPRPMRWHQPVLALGNFDGLHRGHLKIVERVVRTAAERSATPLRPHLRSRTRRASSGPTRRRRC